MTHGAYHATCKDCERLRPLYARNRCQTCYYKMRWNERAAVCDECHTFGPIRGHHLCTKCYARIYNPPHRRKDTCTNCRRRMTIVGRGLCSTCYRKSRATYTKCPQCARYTLIVNKLRGICDACIAHNRRQHAKEVTHE